MASDEVAICILNGHHIASGNCTWDLCGRGLLLSSLCTGCCSCSDITKQVGAEGIQGLSYHWPDHGVLTSPPFAACQHAPPDPLSHQSDSGTQMDGELLSLSPNKGKDGIRIAKIHGQRPVRWLSRQRHSPPSLKTREINPQNPWSGRRELTSALFL